jgi:hypothetical protein
MNEYGDKKLFIVAAWPVANYGLNCYIEQGRLLWKSQSGCLSAEQDAYQAEASDSGKNPYFCSVLRSASGYVTAGYGFASVSYA